MKNTTKKPIVSLLILALLVVIVGGQSSLAASQSGWRFDTSNVPNHITIVYTDTVADILNKLHNTGMPVFVATYLVTVIQEYIDTNDLFNTNGGKKTIVIHTSYGIFKINL